MCKQYKAIVEKVVPDGKHGAYCICTCEEVNGEITFSLTNDVWKEKCSSPEQGTYVILSDVRRKRKGWRAYKARFVRPEDESG